MRLATSGIENAILTVTGRASHAGLAPEQGRNAFYELANRVLNLRDLSDPAKGVKVNWTFASAGSASNVIPEQARAVADMRALRVEDFAEVEDKMHSRLTAPSLIPDTKVQLTFERIFPAMPFREVSVKAANHAKSIYAEIGKSLEVVPTALGAGTDAAFAALRSRAPVIEGFGMVNFGAHSNQAEYIDTRSIEPRLYLLTRMVMDVSDGRSPLGIYEDYSLRPRHGFGGLAASRR